MYYIIFHAPLIPNPPPPLLSSETFFVLYYQKPPKYPSLGTKIQVLSTLPLFPKKKGAKQYYVKYFFIFIFKERDSVCKSKQRKKHLRRQKIPGEQGQGGGGFFIVCTLTPTNKKSINLGRGGSKRLLFLRACPLALFPPSVCMGVWVVTRFNLHNDYTRHDR